jgi:hypothetical protein
MDLVRNAFRIFGEHSLAVVYASEYELHHPGLGCRYEPTFIVTTRTTETTRF